jgi:hypothetical protein
MAFCGSILLRLQLRLLRKLRSVPNLWRLALGSLRLLRCVGSCRCSRSLRNGHKLLGGCHILKPMHCMATDTAHDSFLGTPAFARSAHAHIAAHKTQKDGDSAME